MQRVTRSGRFRTVWLTLLAALWLAPGVALARDARPDPFHPGEPPKSMDHRDLSTRLDAERAAMREALGAGAVGVSGRAGDRTFTACDPAAFPENEFNCGDPTDTINGGCTSQLQRFFFTFCGDFICGTSRFDGLTRDTDWYELILNDQQEVTVTVSADFDAVVGFAFGSGGVPDCAQVTSLFPFTEVAKGQTGSISACLGQGTWWIVVQPTFDQPVFACGAEYEFSVSCAASCQQGACCVGGSCTLANDQLDCLGLGGVYLGDGTTCSAGACVPPLNDDCANAEPFLIGDTIAADLRTATLQGTWELPVCSSQSVASVWYTFTGVEGEVLLSACGADLIDPTASDAIIQIWTGTCGPTTLLVSRCVDDTSGCGLLGRNPEICFFANDETVYYVQISAFDEASQGVYQIQSSFCSPPQPGACCIPDIGCFEVADEGQCNGFLGQWLGGGSSCSDPGVDCSQVAPPPNDFCSTASLLTPGGEALGSTEFASDDVGLFDCGLEIQSPGVWYRAVGTGNQLTVSLCDPATDFDARVHVYCDECPSGLFTCVGANDDSGDASCITAPIVSWCSEAGRTYYIYVSGTLGAAGQFRVRLIESLTPCADPAFCGFCSLTCPQGAIPENEPDCFTDYVDSTNGGCGSSPNVFQDITPGQTICGRSGTFLSGPNFARDTDWFRFELTQRAAVRWEVQAEFLVETFILPDVCPPSIGSFAAGRGNACQTVAAEATLEPGTYLLLVAPQFFREVPCGAEWTGALTATPTPDNFACCLPDQTCIETTLAFCTSLGGSFGDGLLCAEVTCAPGVSCPGDFDGDNQVLLSDFGIFGAFFGQTVPPNTNGDMNGDGEVLLADFGLFANVFGTSCDP